MPQARKMMNREPGAVIAEETKQLYRQILSTPVQKIENIVETYRAELNVLCKKYQAKDYRDLINLADTSQVELSDASTIFDYTSFIERNQ